MARQVDEQADRERYGKAGQRPAGAAAADRRRLARLGEQDPLNKEYLRRLDIASMTDAERAAIGLSGDDWALKMWEGLDRASIKFPTPGFAERHAGKEE